MFGDLLVFFFSSRRRHTRWTGDWSSDVCSSDLAADSGAGGSALVRGVSPGADGAGGVSAAGAEPAPHLAGRSEERRVGKECRSRRSPHHKKKNKEIEGDTSVR